jgi:hypothetical protein
MSRRFTNVSGDHLDLTSATYPNTTPMTLSAWVKRNVTATAQQIVNIGSTGSGNDRWSISYQVADSAAAQTRDAVGSNQGTSSTLAADSSWHLVTGVFVSATSRACFLDGAGKGSNTTSRIPVTPNAIRISGDPSGANRLDGWIAHVAIWDIDLSDAEVLSLMTTEPRLVQPTHLMHYWPLTLGSSPEPDLGQRGEPLIVSGTTFDGTTDPPPFAMLQEAGLLATVIRGVAG